MPKAKKKYTYWRNKLDKAMGALVREKGYCERCGRRQGKLEWSHVIGRRNKTLRWDIMNALCMCTQCHLWWWHEEPLESGKWFEEKYPERYKYVTKAKKYITKWTEDDYKERLKAIEEKDLRALILPEEVLDKLL